MNSKLKNKFILSVCCIIISSVALFCIRFCSDKVSIGSIITAILFWNSLIIGQSLNIYCGKVVQTCRPENKDFKCKRLVQSNKYVITIDVVLAVFIILMALIIAFKINSETLLFIIIAFIYLFLNLHFIFNGRFMNYMCKSKGMEGEKQNENKKKNN